MTDALQGTSAALAQHMVQQVVPRLGSTRTPAYTQPSLTIEALPSCAPAFAEQMRQLCAQLNLDDRAVCPEDVARVLRYHRMYGLKKLYKVSLTGVEMMRTKAQHVECSRTFAYDLTVLVGDLLLTVLGASAYATWFPWNNFHVVLESDRGFRIRCESLEHHTGTDGRPFYASAKAPTTVLRGRTRRVAFAPHALERLAERATPTRSYGSLGDTFGLVDVSQYYEPTVLPGRQEALALFEACAPGFFSHQYAEEILGRLDPSQSYVYRVGYCPLADDGGFCVAKTVLAPGFNGTPEYQVLRTTSFDPGVQERLLERCAQQSYAMLCTTRDFGLLRWFHTHGIPQVKRLVGGRLASD